MPPPQEALLQGLAENTDIEAHVLSCTQQPMQSPEKLGENIWFHLVQVPKIGWLRTGYQGCIRAVRQKLRTIRPDIVHGQGTERECGIAAALSGFPNVITLHGIMREQARLHRARTGSYLWFAAVLEKFALSRTLGVFCNSAYTESLVKPRACQTWRVPNAIRAEFFETPFAPRSTSSKPVLLNIGVISPRKRQLALLDLAEELHNEGQSVEFQFIGSAEPREKYAAEFLDRIQSAERCGFARHIGAMSSADLIAALDAASALVHIPSEESFGLVVAEALARNLKLFATNVGGIPDVAAGIEEAELFSLQDRHGTRAAISKWLGAGCPRPSLAAPAMRSRYHPTVIASRHIEIYRELLNKPL
jgi:glycosyltransferase involved in cell wall biosynthesis